jgi:hypothetical protein
MIALLSLTVISPAHAWVDDFDGDSLHDDWTMTSTGLSGGDEGGVSGGQWTIAPTGGTSWHGIDYERPYAADGDFSFSRRPRGVRPAVGPERHPSVEPEIP